MAKIDVRTGMILNLGDLKEYIRESVLDKLDHKNMNEDVPEFKNEPPTTANVAVFVWNSLLTTKLPSHMLYEIKIYETDKNVVIYRGER
jgi:6-pyruvoyltetrahydropterin/6-carboxytetrahydropterin synthase